MYEVWFYKDKKDFCPVNDLLDDLQPKVLAKVEKWIEQLEKRGPDLPRPYADIVRGKIRELRVDFGTNCYRFLYFFHGKRIIVTHGFLKKTWEIPENEIERAQRYMNDFINRNK